MEKKNLPEVKQKNALQELSARLKVSDAGLTDMLKKTAFKECKTNEEFIAAVIVANTYGLNPLTNEIYAFPGRKGGVVPVIPIDGWIKLVNRQKDYDGVELIDNLDEGGNLISVTAKFYIKSRSHPLEITEYMDECQDKNKPAWVKWPKRMLRHKAYIQGARYAFGFSGIYDEDEARRIVEAEVVDSNPKANVAMPQALTLEPEAPASADPDQQTLDEAADAAFQGPDASSATNTPTAKAIINGKDFTKMKAKFAGLCRHCNAEIAKGTDVYFSTKQGLFHEGCVLVN